MCRCARKVHSSTITGWDLWTYSMNSEHYNHPLCPVRPMGSNWGAVMTRYKPSITISIQSVDFNLSVNSEYFHQLWVLLIRSIPLYPARPVGSRWRVVIIRHRIPAIMHSTWDKKVNRVQSTGYSSIANRLAIKREWFHPALPNLSWSDHHGSVCANIRKRQGGFFGFYSRNQERQVYTTAIFKC